MLFVILYIAYDVVTGVASGAYFVVAQGLPAEQQAALLPVRHRPCSTSHKDWSCS